LVNLVKQLRQRGHDVTLVAFQPENEDPYPDCETLWQDAGATLIKIDYSPDYNEQMAAYMKAAEVYLVAHAAEFDRVVLDSWFNMIAGIKARIIGGTTYHLAQLDPVFRPKDSAKIWEAQLFELLPFYPIQRIVPSRADAALYHERYGNKCAVLPLYLDNTYHQATFEIRERNPLRLVSSASDFNIPHKGLDFLLESLNTFKDFPFTLTLIAGKPIQRDLSMFQFPIEVTAASSPEEMVATLGQCDIYLNTSRKESFCFALAEALAMGMPAVALDSVGNRDYKDGFIFVENDEDFLLQLATLASGELRQNWAAKGKESVNSYTLAKTVNAFEGIIKIG